MSSSPPLPLSEAPRLPRPPADHQIQSHNEAQVHENEQAQHTMRHAATARAAPINAPRSLWMEFILGGTATMTACLFTNPIEVVKTRMQVQGELASRTGTTRPYKTMFHAFYTIAKNEGIRGLQGGLGPAALYQLFMNGTRLGLYDPLKRFYSSLLHDDKRSALEPHVLTNVLAGSSSGLIAAVVGSPFFMMKVRLQVQNKSSSTTSVGHQHHYRGAWSGLAQVAREEGIKGLYRGVEGAMLRVGIGSGVQLSTYDACKHFVINHGMQEGVMAHFAASLISGFIVTVAMNPPDVISTRLYNQPVENGKGALYKSLPDCFAKTIRSEGIFALYKGFWAHYFRLGPHTILTFVFWEQAKSLATKWGL